MSGSRPRQPSTEEVNNVAVIAAWCDSPAHLAPAPVDAYLSDSGHRALCTVVARAWDPCNPARSQDLEGLLEGEAAEDSGEDATHWERFGRHLPVPMASIDEIRTKRVSIQAPLRYRGGHAAQWIMHTIQVDGVAALHMVDTLHKCLAWSCTTLQCRPSPYSITIP